MSGSASYKIPTSQPASAARRDHAVAYSDIRLLHEPDGGNLVFSAGRFDLDDGLYAAVYVSLFGGNSDDAGDSATADKQWWGNVIAGDDMQRLRSEYQYTLSTIACTPSDLRKLDAAASRDLAPLVASGLATEASANTRITGHNMVETTVNVVVDGTRREYRFSQLGGR